MDGQEQRVQCERFRRLVVGYRSGLFDQLGEQHILGCRRCLEWLHGELPHRDYMGLLGADEARLLRRIRELIFVTKAEVPAG
jgi:hypothetical protein